jgi:hypothetical protein
VAGGSEDGKPLSICRIVYRGGVHPGKLVAGNCHIGWGGQAISATHYEVMVASGSAAAIAANAASDCPQCPPWVSQSSSGSYLPLAAQAEIWSSPKPFIRPNAQLTVSSRFLYQKGTTCRFEVQFNNVGNKAVDENTLLARPGKVAVSQYDHLIRIKLNPGARYAFATEVLECPLNWGESKDMEKCAACQPVVYFAAQ